MKLYFVLRSTLMRHLKSSNRSIAYVWKNQQTAPNNPLAYFPNGYVGTNEHNWVPYRLKKL